MARPRQSDPAIVAVAAHELAERTVEEWDRTGSVEDWVGPLSKEMRYSHRDGYELARELERYHGITPDSQLVELLDDTYSVVRSAYTDALTKWVKFTGWTPRYTKGDRVLWRGKPGIVNGVKAETSEMYFAPDEEAPRYNQGGGYVVVEDDLTPASAIEARSDETRSGSAEGESAASEAGDAR